MLKTNLFKALRVVALSLSVSLTAMLCLAAPAKAQLVPNLPVPPPSTVAAPPNTAAPPPTAVAPPTQAPAPAPAPGMAKKKPAGMGPHAAPAAPPSTYVERQMHKVSDFIEHNAKDIMPILPGLVTGLRIGLLLIFLFSYVFFHFQRQKRAALEAEQERRLSAAEIEFGTGIDLRPGSQENAP